MINGREYVPFMDVDLHEKFAYVMPYTDKNGLLPLAAKQKQLLKSWSRPEEFLEHPSIIQKIDSGTIKQVNLILFAARVEDHMDMFISDHYFRLLVHCITGHCCSVRETLQQEAGNEVSDGGVRIDLN